MSGVLGKDTSMMWCGQRKVEELDELYILWGRRIEPRKTYVDNSSTMCIFSNGGTTEKKIFFPNAMGSY